jgi:uncharacterized protein (TIGR02996 family)
MTEEESLILAILDCPEDRTARVVFADFLDEQGCVEQAEAIRLRCALAELPERNERWMELDRREWHLSEKHLGDWVEHCGLPLNQEQAFWLFRWRLAETIAWWCACGDGSLRTAALVPAFKPQRHQQSLLTYPPSGCQVIVNGLAATRARLLTNKGLRPASPANELFSGRLLMFFPEDTLSDGAAEVFSEGFFDADNIPAWDGWVMYVDVSGAEVPCYGSSLVCWVPPALLDRVDHGIGVNAEGCIRWASEVDTAFTQSLREAGLLA